VRVNAEEFTDVGKSDAKATQSAHDAQAHVVRPQLKIPRGSTGHV